MPKTSVSNIQKVQIFPGKHAPGPPTLLCTKWQFYLTKMQKSIPNRMFHQEKITNLVSHFSFFLCPFSLFLFLCFLFLFYFIFFFWGGGSSQLIWVKLIANWWAWALVPKRLAIQKGGHPQKFLKKRGVIICHRSYLSSHQPPPPLPH